MRTKVMRERGSIMTYYATVNLLTLNVGCSPEHYKNTLVYHIS